MNIMNFSPSSRLVRRICGKSFGGITGALRIPSLSFQYLRRPGCTAKLLSFHIAGGFESHRLHQLFLYFSFQALITEAIKCSLIKIFGREKYLFENSRGVVGRNCAKIGETEPF